MKGKGLAKYIKYVLLVILILILLIIALSQWKPVQQKVVQKGVEWLSQELDVEVKVDQFHWEGLQDLALDGFLIRDLQSDTLIAASSLTVHFSFWSLFQQKVILDEIVLDNALVRIRQNEESTMNFQFVLDAFTTPTTDAEDTLSTETAWAIEPDALAVNDFRFEYFDDKTKDQLIGNWKQLVIDFTAVDLENQRIEIATTQLASPDIKYGFNPSTFPDTLSENLDTIPTELSFPNLGWTVQLDELKIAKGALTYQDQKLISSKPASFDPANIRIQDLELLIKNFYLDSLHLSGDLRTLSLKEQSGVVVNNLTSNIILSENIVSLNSFELETPTTKINQSLELKFPNLSTLSKMGQPDFIAQKDILIDWQVIDTKINPKDINQLVSNVLPSEITNPFLLDINLKGTLDELKIDHVFFRQSDRFLLNAKGRLSQPLDIDQLRFDLDFTELRANYFDLKLFLPDGTLPPALEDWGTLAVSGLVAGKLGDFKSENLKIDTDNGPKVLGDVQIKGLPDVQTANYQVRLDTLITNVDHWRKFATDSLPGLLDDLGMMSLSGTFNGTMYDFVTEVKLNSAIGKFSTDASFQFDENYSNAVYKGEIKLGDFDLGKMVGDTSLKAITLDAEIDGKGLGPKDLDTKITASLTDLMYKNYAYDSIYLDGHLVDESFDGQLNIQDPNLQFLYKGIIPLTDTLTAAQFSLEVDTVNFYPLGFYHQPLGLKTKLTSNISDFRLNTLEGNIVFDYFSISDSINNYSTDSILITSEVDSEKGRALKWESELLSFGIEGDYQLTQLPSEISSWLDEFFPITKIPFLNESQNNGMDAETLVPRLPSTDINAYLSLSDPTELTAIFLPELIALDTVDLDLKFSNQNKEWNLNGWIPKLEYGDFKIDTIRLASISGEDELQTTLSADAFQRGKNTIIPKPSLDVVLKNEEMGINLISTREDSIFWDVGGVLTNAADRISFSLKNQIRINGRNWTVAQNNKITYGIDHTWTIDDLEFSKDKKRIGLLGNSNSGDGISKVDIFFEHFDIAVFSPLLDYPDGYISGTLEGKVALRDIGKNLNYTADLELKKWMMDSVVVGDLMLSAQQLTNQSIIDVGVELGGYGNEIMGEGNYDLEQKRFDIDATIKRVEMKTVDPFLPGLIHDSEGFLSGKFAIKGDADNPKLEGSINFNEVKTVIDYVNTVYQVNKGNISFTEKEIDFSTIEMLDQEDRFATLVGKINHDFFEKMEMDLHFLTDQFQFLNTTAVDNELFYGDLLLKADVAIQGPIEEPRFKIDAITQPKTEFFVVPLTDEQAIAREDFILFGKPGLDSLGRDTNFIKNYQLTSPGVDLLLNLELTPDANLQVIVDPLTGDKLVCKGRSSLTVEMDPAANVKVNGSYVITEGKYSFSYEQLLKREFSILRGSDISFNGDPLKAKLNITAAYETRVLLSELVSNQISSSGSSSAGSQRVDIQVQMKITGDLVNPILNFDIVIMGNPQGSLVDAATTRLEQIRGNESELNTQVFGLLLFNSFISSESGGQSVTTAGESALLSSVSKLVSNQLNRLANKFIKGVDFSLGVEAYKPGVDPTGNSGVSTELQLGLSKRLLNDRLTVKVGGNVNLGASGQEQESLTAFTGDFALEYQLTESGNYILRVYRKSDFDALNEGNVSRTGAGISIKKRLKNKQRKRKE